MADLFGIDIAGLVNEHVSSGLLPTLVQFKELEAVDPDNPLRNRVKVLNAGLNGRGVVETYKAYDIDGTIIKAGDRRVLLIVKSFPLNMPVPYTGCRITIEGESLTIVGDVKRDPAGATYTCQVRV